MMMRYLTLINGWTITISTRWSFKIIAFIALGTISVVAGEMLVRSAWVALFPGILLCLVILVRGILRLEEGEAFGSLDLLAFLIPATTFIEVRIIGRLFAPDVLLACMIPLLFVAGKDRELAYKLPKTFILLAGLWLFGQVVTDLVRHTPFRDWSRGWAKIIFFIINFAALCMLIERRPRRIVLYAAGLSLGYTLKFFLNPDIYAIGAPWKFGYGVPLTWAIILLATVLYREHSFHRMLVFVILAGIGLVNIIQGFRSLGGVILLTLIFLGVRSFRRRRTSNFRAVSKREFVLVIIVLLIGAWASLAVYSTLAKSGILGEKAKALYERQSTGKFGILLGGRLAVLSAALAIKDSPLLGHGSWAKDPRYVELLLEIQRRLGYIFLRAPETDLIPTHSIILGAWVEAGLLGAIVWIWAAFVAMRFLSSAFGKDLKLAPFVVFFAFQFLWDLLFSPYGAVRRFETTFLLVALISALNWMQEGETVPTESSCYETEGFGKRRV